MKRILLVIEHLGPGGAERQICGLAVMLTKAGYPCRLITYVENQFYETFLKENGVDYKFVPELWNIKTCVFNAVKYVQEYNPDVVISYLPSANKRMCLAKLFFKARLVVSERNNNVCITRDDRIRFNLYRIANAIVPNSNCQGEYIRKNFPFLAAKVRPIINYVDENRFSPAEKPPHNDIATVITVARYTPQKNVLTYLNAIRAVKTSGIKVHFDWYGDKSYNPSYYAEIEKTCKLLDISDYIMLHEPNKNIEDVYHGANIFCLPSLYEGYPNVLVEAMACGLPVICSNRYENPYIVADGINGYLFDPENVDDIVKAIRKVVSLTPEEKHEIGKRNRKKCLERNAEKTFLQSYVNLIESL